MFEISQLSARWKLVFESEASLPYFRDLTSFLEAQRNSHTIFPPTNEVFAAFELTPLEKVRVLILGQDPYHDDDQAHGLCFSVRLGIKIPPSLRNIYRELRDDLGIELPEHGCLSDWAKQGVLLLNTVLTVRAHDANSHRKRGWEKFTDCVIETVSQKESKVVFVLWGKPAQTKKNLIDESKHLVIESAHPSPLSARRGFFGSRPFSRINAALVHSGQDAIDWRL